MIAPRTGQLEAITTERHQRIAKAQPHFRFVPAMRVRASSDLIFLSGIIGTPDVMPKGLDEEAIGDIRTQATRLFERMKSLLAVAGADFCDVVRITKYMTDLEQHGPVVEVMCEYFGDHLPASTTIEVRRLVPPGFGLEIDAIAAVPARD